MHERRRVEVRRPIPAAGPVQYPIEKLRIPGVARPPSRSPLNRMRLGAPRRRRDRRDDDLDGMLDRFGEHQETGLA